MIQWLESSRQREDLKLVFNRRMRTRMYGGVGGGRSNADPIPIRFVIRSHITFPDTVRASQCSENLDRDNQRNSEPAKYRM